MEPARDLAKALRLPQNLHVTAMTLLRSLRIAVPVNGLWARPVRSRSARTETASPRQTGVETELLIINVDPPKRGIVFTRARMFSRRHSFFHLFYAQDKFSPSLDTTAVLWKLP